MMSPDEMVKYLREKASAFDYQGWTETAIDYEQAADVIEELSKRVEGLEAAQEISPEAQHFVDTKADNIIDGLQNLLASVKERPHWIPVTDHTPKYSGYYLVRDNDDDVYTAYFGNTWNNWWTGNAITHWMPLPEPPKEEE